MIDDEFNQGKVCFFSKILEISKEKKMKNKNEKFNCNKIK